jgi:hypothetical protein
MLLIALLSGGDYDVSIQYHRSSLSTKAMITKTGVPGCGTGIAHSLSHSGLGDSLLDAATSLSASALHGFLVQWRDKLRNELATDAGGFLGRKYPALARAVPDTFPGSAVLCLYTNPITSWSNGGQGPEMRLWQPRQPDIAGLAAFCERSFTWGSFLEIPIKFRKHIWEGVCIRRLSSVWFICSRQLE